MNFFLLFFFENKKIEANFSETCYSVSDLLVIGSLVHSTAKSIATLTHRCCVVQTEQFCLHQGTHLFRSFPGKWLLSSNLFLRK